MYKNLTVASLPSLMISGWVGWPWADICTKSVFKELPPDELTFLMFLQEHNALFFDHTICLHLLFILLYVLFAAQTKNYFSSR